MRRKPIVSSPQSHRHCRLGQTERAGFRVRGSRPGVPDNFRMRLQANSQGRRPLRRGERRTDFRWFSGGARVANIPAGLNARAKAGGLAEDRSRKVSKQTRDRSNVSISCLFALLAFA